MVSKAELKRLRALQQRRNREQEGLFLVEGVRLVEELLRSAIVLRAAYIAPTLEDTGRGAALARALRERLPTEAVAAHDLTQLADAETPQGVVVVAELPRWSLEALVLPERALVVVLDAVQDPGNFGTIVRSADAFGAAFVAALPGTVEPWNPKAVRSAAGSSFRVPIIETSLASLTMYHEAQRITLIGADVAGRAVAELRSPARVAIALGNEGGGLSENVRAVCSSLVSVPIRGAAESLNVGVAAGILMYVLSREQ